jgi:hypothetical protein
MEGRLPQQVPVDESLGVDDLRYDVSVLAAIIDELLDAGTKGDSATLTALSSVYADRRARLARAVCDETRRAGVAYRPRS